MFIATLKTIFSDEVDQLINLESATRSEIIVRHIILVFLCLVGAAYFEILFPVIWIIVYGSSSIIVHFAFVRLGRFREFRTYLAILGLALLQLVIFRAMILYLWFFPHMAAHYIGVFMLLASMRFAVNLKARVPSHLFIHAFGDLVVFAILAQNFFFSRPDLEGAFLIGLTLICFMVYYVITLRQNLSYLREMRLLEKSNRQAQKMEAVGRLTGGVAHDFNNILTVVLGNLELHKELTDQSERDELLDNTRKAASRAADLTSQLLAFSRKSTLKQEVHQIHEIFDHLRTLTDRLLPANITLETRVLADTPPIRVDKTQLEVALINLIINARDAMPSGGKLDLLARRDDRRDDRRNPDLDLVCMCLTDEGGGIPNDLLDKVAEPFFTTKPVGKGSGLGLSMVKGFAEQSGGYIEITTEPGKSTTVSICVPAVSKTPS